MKIQLLSISHRTASAQIRGMFSFSKEQQMHLLGQLMAQSGIQEAVVLSTCNRTEVYCGGTDDNYTLQKMEELLLEEARASDVLGIKDCILRFYGESAVHHLFLVAAGLDSVVLGEDQILGQVKQAYFFSKELGYCTSVFHSLFQFAISSAKKIKTDTLLSKTSVSTATLALKEAKTKLGTLNGKKMMILGASGKIGGIVLKDAMDIKGLEIYVTVRDKLPHALRKRLPVSVIPIPYEERYQWMDRMDVIISATSSPHYTVTREHWSKSITTKKQRVFFDMAVPMDIEPSIGQLPDTFYASMEDMERLARENNQKKEHFVPGAEIILGEYEEKFLKKVLYRENRECMEELKNRVLTEAEETSVEKALDHLFYGIKEESNAEQFRYFSEIVRKITEKERED